MVCRRRLRQTAAVGPEVDLAEQVSLEHKKGLPVVSMAQAKAVRSRKISLKGYSVRLACAFDK